MVDLSYLCAKNTIFICFGRPKWTVSLAKNMNINIKETTNRMWSSLMDHLKKITDGHFPIHNNSMCFTKL